MNLTMLLSGIGVLIPVIVLAIMLYNRFGGRFWV